MNYLPRGTIVIEEVDSEEAFLNALEINRKLLVLFYASWCPFCRSFLPIFEKHARLYGSSLRVKIDDEANPLWDTYTVEAVPTVLFFEGGRVSKRLDATLGVGLSEQQLRDMLEEI